MARQRRAILFLTDQNVPDSIGDFLVKRGHDVVRVREIMPTNSPDPVVAEAAMHSGRILVSWDKDFHQQRFQKPRFQTLSRLAFSCPEIEGVDRLKSLIELIEMVVRSRKSIRPTIIKIGKSNILINE